MKKLDALVREAFPDSAFSLPGVPVAGIECDSRSVRSGFVFVAVKGTRQDGGVFAAEACRRGAIAIFSETPISDLSVPVLIVPDARAALAKLAAVFYEHPSKALRMVGVTGTNGKTTTTFLIEYLLSRLGIKTGVIGTIYHGVSGRFADAANTTPGSLEIQKLLNQFREDGCGAAAMEVSSHALEQQRVHGIDFEAAVFTNLTQDHLDYHGTFERYFEAKSRLFGDLQPGRHAILNADDPWTKRLAKKTKGKVLTYGTEASARFRAEGIRFKEDHTEFDLVWGRERIANVFLPLVGRHNVLNTLAALAALCAMGFEWTTTVPALADFPGVPGRLEAVRCGQDFKVYIDFAHTPDGLRNVLEALRSYRQTRLIALFGCGGDRDRGKRPQMARIASEYCDHVYVTSDNPRSEDPSAIADEICSGFPGDFKNFKVILDRREAIRLAMESANSGDIILLAGKGHERTQIIGERKIPFSEREEAEKILRTGIRSQA